MSNDRRSFLTAAGLGAAALGLFGLRGRSEARTAERFEVALTEAEWRKRLTPSAFAVLRKDSTETPYTSPLNAEKRTGVYACAGCSLPLFTSKTKFESGTGWPSFWAPLTNATRTTTDRKMLFERVEVHCRRCGGHLGHVFDDGPKPTGKRYCMNGVAMKFRAMKV